MNIQPSVLCAGFKYHQGAGAGGIGYELDQSPTPTAAWHSPVVIQVKGNAIARDTSQTGRWACDPDENGAFTLNATDVDGVMLMTDTQPHAMVDQEVCGTLSATMHKDPPVLCMQNTTSKAAVDHDMCGTLTAGGGRPDDCEE